MTKIMTNIHYTFWNRRTKEFKEGTRFVEGRFHDVFQAVCKELEAEKPEGFELLGLTDMDYRHRPVRTTAEKKKEASSGE